MNPILNDSIFIDPKPSQYRRIAQMIQAQGDGRGLVLTESNGEQTLIVFDSYGNTHSTIVGRMSLRRDDYICLIFRLNGTLFVDDFNSLDAPLDDSFFGSVIKAQLAGIYKHMNHANVIVTSGEM